MLGDAALTRLRIAAHYGSWFRDDDGNEVIPVRVDDLRALLSHLDELTLKACKTTIRPADDESVG